MEKIFPTYKAGIIHIHNSIVALLLRPPLNNAWVGLCILVVIDAYEEQLASVRGHLRNILMPEHLAEGSIGILVVFQLHHDGGGTDEFPRIDLQTAVYFRASRVVQGEWNTKKKKNFLVCFVLCPAFAIFANKKGGYGQISTRETRGNWAKRKDVKNIIVQLFLLKWTRFSDA